MMIELVMYGMIPSAKRLNRVSARPEKSWRKASTPPSRAWSSMALTAFWSMPGTGMNDPSRYRTRMKRLNRILLRRSGTLTMFPIRDNSTLLSPTGLSC